MTPPISSRVATAVDDVQRTGYSALLDSVRAASDASHATTVDEFEEQASRSLERLAAALDAQRACLCLFEPDWSRDVVAHFVTGGTPDVGAVGPAFLGLGADDVPEWLGAELEPQVHRRESLSPRLRAVVAAAQADWIMTSTSRSGGRAVSTLSVLGRGEPGEPDPDVGDTVAAIGGLLGRAVVAMNRQRREGTFATAQLRLALDVIDEGVMFLDRDGRPLAMNRACERQLGCGMADLDGRPFWEQFDLRSWQGDPVAATERAMAEFRHLGRFGPVLVRLVNRQGLTTTGSLRVRRIAGEGCGNDVRMVAVFNETPDVGAPELSPFGWMRQAHAVRALSQELGDAEVSDQVLAERLASLDLTTRETEIVAMLLRGHRVSTIAERLYLSPHTIRNHLKAVIHKLQVTSQVELVATVRARVRS